MAVELPKGAGLWPHSARSQIWPDRTFPWWLISSTVRFY